jgi:molybdopterin/thiamine biosynthesis adenylyltransferase
MGHANLVVTDQSADYPDFLKRASSSSNKQANIYQAPIIINMELESGAEQLKELIAKHSNLDVIDNYAEQYAELLLSRNAHLYRANYEVQVASIQETLEQHYGTKKAWQMGSWVFFPWNNQLIHILAQEDFENLRTIRNRDLIDEEEQKKLLDFNVASFGMSVGSAGAMVLSLSGISRKIKLIDGAVISGSNLNRILTGVSSVGKSKALVVGQQIYEMNPYSSVEHFDKVNKDNIEEIFDKPWKIDLAVDEIDDIEMKVRIRFEARKRKIPVIMATELGDTVMLDVERFDEEKDRKLFHGLVPNIENLLDTPLENYREWTKHAVSIIDPENMPIKMQKSVLKIGTNIVTHPQLGSTVMMTGGVLTFAAKHIALGNQLKSGRYIIALEKEFLSDHKTRKHRREHKKHTKIIKRSVSSM